MRAACVCLRALILLWRLRICWLDFFGDQVNGRVKVAFPVFSEKVGAAHAEPDRAGKLFLRRAGMVMFQRDAGVHGAVVEVFQLVQFGKNMIFNSLGESHVMRRKDQFHTLMMLRTRKQNPVKVAIRPQSQIFEISENLNRPGGSL